MYCRPIGLDLKKGLCPETLPIKIFKTSFLLCSPLSLWGDLKKADASEFAHAH